LLGNHPQILPREDRDPAERVAKALRRDGLELTLSCQITRVEKRVHEKVVHLVCGEGQREIVVDAILVGAGRVPNVEGLNLAAAGVRHDRKGSG
jgi:pyruvate/2-oxoglutarate dehydrogenase complex dihydrolipoamide dehydrogenase (E3) component